MNVNDFYEAVREPEVITPLPAATTTALARFVADPAALKASALDVLSIAVRPVDTQEAAASLSNKVAEATQLARNIEARRKLIVEPLKRDAAAVDAEAKRWSGPVNDWIGRAKTVLLAFQRMDGDRKRRSEEARQAELRKAAEQQLAAVLAGDNAAADTASMAIMQAEAQTSEQAIRGFKTDAGSTHTRKRWKVEIVDAEKVPPAYLMVDLKKLQAAVDAGAREIEGCNIFEEESIAVLTRR